ncbi:MAG: NAD-dependent epimerase/dehydratase family protein, partial [Victivallales bacterium]|nr:NAD-dependent epimerase/dehydratase family protein [Victivallales bacterium]
MNINKTKRILVAGATGAMGQYLVPLLAETGAEITAVALDKCEGAFPNVHSVTGNFRDDEEFRSLVLKEKFDAIVDFMIYPANFGCIRLPECLDTTGHYIYLSSYRIYADCEHPIRETSPRLIDASTDQLLLNSDDYCIFKARGENIIRSFDRKNWT